VNPDIAIVLAVLAVAVILFALDWIADEVVALGTSWR
jgi:hypothetical protein